MHILHVKQNVEKGHFLRDPNISTCAELLTGDLRLVLQMNNPPNFTGNFMIFCQHKH